jgi:hypothetical protein
MADHRCSGRLDPEEDGDDPQLAHILWAEVRVTPVALVRLTLWEDDPQLVHNLWVEGRADCLCSDIGQCPKGEPHQERR